MTNPACAIALTELLSHEDRVELIGTAGDAEEAIRIAEADLPDVALVDVRMPAGGGPHAARGISRVSPATRVIALSAYEDRANVLEMLRAGAVGYLVKGTAVDELVQGIENVAQGGTSLSAEVMSGVVAELATQLRREEIERETDQALRGDIERFVSGHGVWMVFQPIVDLETREEVGVEALARFGSIPAKPPDQWFAEATAIELGLQLELRTMNEALHGLPKIPDGVFLSVNCSHHTAGSPELRRPARGCRAPHRPGDHGTRGDRRLRRARGGARAAPRTRPPRRRRRRRRRLREPPSRAPARARHGEDGYLAHQGYRPRSGRVGRSPPR